MTHRLVSKFVTVSVAAACASILSGCWWGHREPRRADRVVVRDDHHEVHDDHHEEHRDDR